MNPFDEIGKWNPFKKASTPDLAGPNAKAIPQVSAPGIYADPVKGSTIAAPNVQQVAAPTAAQIDMQPQGQFRDTQAGLINQLTGQAMGTGPSIAENQFRAATEANIAASMAAANSARGGANPALQRAAMQQNAQVQGQLSQDVANARLQEQMTAAGMLGQVTQGAREQDIGLAMQQAAMQQQAGLAGYQGAIDQNQFGAQLGQQAGMFNAQQTQQAALQFQQLQQQYAAMGMSAQQANQMAALDVEKMKMGVNQFNAQQDLAATQGQQQMVGGLISGIAGVGTGMATAGAFGGNQTAAPGANNGVYQ
jgi:hypothetical protein